MYEMHIHLMGHYIYVELQCSMSKGKALCCELKTGHIWKLHMYRELSVLHVRTQKPSLNRVQRFTMCVCLCVCVCVCVCVLQMYNIQTMILRKHNVHVWDTTY